MPLGSMGQQAAMPQGQPMDMQQPMYSGQAMQPSMAAQGFTGDAGLQAQGMISDQNR
jgi:hypothetical protein